jgi:RNA polymerase sigma-70 factor (ECF subfamily)
MPAHGKEPEFVRLLTRHSSQIYGFILMLCANRSDAEDVLQDTSVVLWEKFDTYTPGTSFQAWACRIAYYEAMSRRRSGRRIQYLSDSVLALLATDALSIMEQNDLNKDALADCLEKLAETDRRLIEQKYFIQLSTSEIAERSSRSIHAIYRALTRVHGLLLRCMRKALESA